VPGTRPDHTQRAGRPASDARARVDRETEKSLLGALLVDPDAVKEVRPLVRLVDFSTERNQLIYSAILELDSRGIRPDFVCVQAYLSAEGLLFEKVGTDYLTALCLFTPSSTNVLGYAYWVAAAGARDRGEEDGRHPAAIPI
jgi:replicative DNA helicase